MRDPIRVLLVDDHAVLRAGLTALLNAEPYFEVVGEAAGGEEAVEKARQLKPQVVVMDLTMPGIGGIEATRQITALGLGIKVLALTMHAEDEFLVAVLEAGGSGYVLKSSADQDLKTAIRTVANDEIFMYPSAAKLVFQEVKTKKPGNHSTV